MVQRSKRSLDAHRAAAMRQTTLDFQHELRRWCGQIPIGTATYVALQALGDSVNLALGQLMREIDGDRGAGGYGRRDIHDFD